MELDDFEERRIPLAEVPLLDFMPRRRNGKPIHTSTIYRWADRGLKGCRLETTSVGGLRCTTESKLRRFFGTLSGEPVDAGAPDRHGCRPIRRKEAIEKAGRELEALGL